MNEAAGRTDPGVVGEALDELGAAGGVEVASCADESELDAILDRRRDRTLVVIGGDGSLHTTVGRLWLRGEAARCPVGLIPLGTGNDFARGCGIPLAPREAARLILDGKPVPVDLISDDGGGVAINAVHVGVGADAAVVARPLKPYLRIASFPVGGLIAGVRARGWRIKVVVDGVTVNRGSRRILMVALSNGPTIAGGTARLAPHATPTDGLVNVTVSMSLGRRARIGYALGLMRGTHHERADVRTLTGRVVTLHGEAFHINADGEVGGPLTRRVWAVQPGAWRCFIPR